MSLLLHIECPGTLSIRDILRLVADIDGDNRIHLRTATDATAVLTPFIQCDSGDMSVADILRGALVLDTSDGLTKLLVSE